MEKYNYKLVSIYSVQVLSQIFPLTKLASEAATITVPIIQLQT